MLSLYNRIQSSPVSPISFPSFFPSMAASGSWPSHPPSNYPSAIQSNTPVYSSQDFYPVVKYTSPYATTPPYPSQQPLSTDADLIQLPSSIGPSRTKYSFTGIVTRQKAAQVTMQSSCSRDSSGSPGAVNTNGHPSQVSSSLMSGFRAGSTLKGVGSSSVSPDRVAPMFARYFYRQAIGVFGHARGRTPANIAGLPEEVSTLGNWSGCRYPSHIQLWDLAFSVTIPEP